MQIYQDEWPGPAEWNVAARLILEDDGHFSYSEYWTCYLATSGGEAQGRWSRCGDTLVLHPEKHEGATILRMEPGSEIVGVIVGEIVKFDSGCDLRLQHEPAQAAVRPAPAAPKAAVPRVAPVPALPGAQSIPAPAASPVAVPVRTPSDTLSTRIRALINDLAPPAQGLSLNRLCREWNALPLHADSIYVWALQPDGTVLRIDHESFRQDGEPETDPLLVRTALVHGSEKYPELAELL